MRKTRMIFKLSGVILAITGAVIIIHTVPVFVWYVALVALIVVFAFIMLNT